MRKWIIAGILLTVLVSVCIIPSVSFTEDADTLHLARVIYALGKTESYDVKLALGTVVMNRVDSRWFGNTLPEVLDDAQQFPAGERYDEESLRAAHAVISGTRTLDSSILYYHYSDLDDSETASRNMTAVGSYNFSTDDRSIMVTGLL